MKIILRENIAGLGERGEVVSVKPGYARNFLLPRGKALPASEGNVKRVETERKRFVMRDAKDIEAAQLFAERMKDLSLTVAKKVGEDQMLYGSVTASDILELLHAQGFKAVDRKQVVIDEPIKKLGIYDVPIALHPKVRPTVKVWVVKEEE